MKASLHFNLSDPMERDQHAKMLKAEDCHAALESIMIYLHQKIKYSKPKNKLEEAVLEERKIMHKDFLELLNDNQLNI